MGLFHFVLFGFLFLNYQEVSFKSVGLQGLTFTSDSTKYFILDDQQDSVEINQITDQHGNNYWYRHVDTEVCLTGDCKRIEIGIVWDLVGDFKGIEVYNEPLTKTDHSDFKPWDYLKLLSILENDWSILREYSMEELIDNPDDEVDGKTGATKKEISEESVEDAVYTTFTMWHLIHQGEKQQLEMLTSKLLSNKSFLKKIISSKEEKYKQLVLNQYAAGNVLYSNEIQALVLENLQNNQEGQLYQSALLALSKCSIADFTFQNQIASIYKKNSSRQKLELLSALDGVYTLMPAFYTVISEDLNSKDEWLAIKILPVLMHSAQQSNVVLKKIEVLKTSTNPVLLLKIKEFEK